MQQQQKETVVFISASFLVGTYKQVAPSILSSSIFFFGSDRRWLFPSCEDDIADSKKQPTNYLGFPTDFKEIILAKEKEGRCFWLKPERNFKSVSACFERLGFAQLKLSADWWHNDFVQSGRQQKARFCQSAERIVENFQKGDHEYSEVMELLVQSDSRLQPMLDPPKTVCFISASYLVREYATLPAQLMEQSIFFFGSARHWIFPSNEAERQESKRQPTKYLEFPETFKQLILAKEAVGRCFFLKPEKDFGRISTFFEKLGYAPLKLDDRWWKEEFSSGKFCKDPHRVVINYKTGEHDYQPTMELIYQSNPQIDPVLSSARLQQLYC